MNELFLSLSSALIESGPLGLAIICCFIAMAFVLGVLFFQTKITTQFLQAQLEECKIDKAQLIALVQSNIQSIDQNTYAINHCTSLIQTCMQLVQSTFDRLKKDTP
jgi:sensor histidine kinase regulating citrate/malate metabolism